MRIWLASDYSDSHSYTLSTLIIIWDRMNKGLFLGGFVQLKRYESQQNEMEKAKRHGIRHLSSLRLAMHLHPPLPPLITPTHLPHSYQPVVTTVTCRNQYQGLVILSYHLGNSWPVAPVELFIPNSKLQIPRPPNGWLELRKSSLKPKAHTVWELEGIKKAIWFNLLRNIGIYSAVCCRWPSRQSVWIHPVIFCTATCFLKSGFLLEVLRITACKWTALSPLKDN